MSALRMKYFVLKPKGTDKYAEASRKAMRAYANHISKVNEELADELREWASRESTAAIESPDAAQLVNEIEEVLR